MAYPLMHLEVGRKWSSPDHPDDTHKIKEEIFKAVGRRKFESKVGQNPDIQVNDAGIIVLKGVGDRKRLTHVTGIRADDFLIFKFGVAKDSDEIDIALFVPTGQPADQPDGFAEMDAAFLIPRDEAVFHSLVDYFFVRAEGLRRGETLVALLIFTD